MSTPQHHTTRPEDRIPFPKKLAYGAGAFVNNLLGAAPGEMMIVLNLGLGMDPVLIGWLGFIPRITDAITDPLMGFISDGTRSRWGRRRPYIFAGAILVAIIFAAMWQLSPQWSQGFTFVWFLLFSIFFYIAYTMMATPWVALGYELTPDYHERTRLMGTQYFAGSVVYLVTPWFLAIMNSGKFFRDAAGKPDQIAGAGGLAIVIAVVVLALGILPAIFLRERSFSSRSAAADPARSAPPMAERFREFFAGFAATLKSGPFLKLCAATFLIFNGFILVASFQKYVLIYYVFAGDQTEGAKWFGIAGSVTQFSAFGAVVLVTWLSTRIGKRRTFIAATYVAMLGYALKWFCYNPAVPWMVLIPAPLLGFSLSTLFTLMPSMTADVVDLDELNTHQRREGMYGSIYWFMVKLGLSAALLGSGYLLNATGFDVDLGPIQAPRTLTLMRLFDAGVPVLTSLLAIWAVSRFPLTEEKAYAIRRRLEDRRGKAQL
ncbi:MFS transporter [bacterium DOLZORAL124_64_63]|nr:MAG: MFS transporter [bacterium DOLZORAL124_64_63]